ncbi:MAG TPA: VWA domain-containing protein [Oscillatoriaceae cyanobacterium]
MIQLQALLARQPLPEQTESLAYVLLKAIPSRVAGRAGLNLTIVVDRSQAIESENRLAWVQRALGALAEALRPDDIVSLVVFGDRAKLLLPAEAGAGAKLKRMVAFLDSHAMPGRATVLEGLKLGGEELKKNLAPGRVNRMVVLTASPITQEFETEALARVFAEQHIGVSAFGLGTDWSPFGLVRLAEAGRGSAVYVPRPADLPALVAQEMEHLQELAFLDLRLHLRFTRGLSARRLFQVFPTIAHWLPSQPTERDAILALGSLPAGRPCYLLAELRVPPRAAGECRLAGVDLSYTAAGPAPQAVRAAVDIEARVGADPATVNFEVLRYVAAMQAFLLVERALEARADGETEKTLALLKNAVRITEDSDDGLLMHQLETALESLEKVAMLPEAAAKELYFSARAAAMRF